MKTFRLSVRIDAITYRKLAERGRTDMKAESEIVREALAAHLDHAGESAYDVLKRTGGIGVARRLPQDLSTNKEYMKGFGSSDPASSPRHRPARRAPRSR